MERKYQIFISSTFIDLKKEREEVIKQILKNYHFPIGMEMFSASDKKQWEIIKKTIDSSDIYILLLGFRYGSIDQEEGVSYTEKEFNYALQKKKPVIVFVKEEHEFVENLKILHDSNDIKATKEFYQTFYDENQERIQRFRYKAMDNRLVNFFSSTSIDVQSAINKKITEIPTGGWVRQDKIQWHFVKQSRFYITLFSIIVLFALYYYTSGVGLIQNQLIASNTDLFYMAKPENLEFARVLPDGQSLESEASIAETFRTTDSSFLVVTTAFKQLGVHELVIDSAIKRGVKFKVLLIDTNTIAERKINSHLIYNTDTSLGTALKNKMSADLNNTLQIARILKRNAQKMNYMGDIEVRFLERPLYYQMWIKDPSNDKGLAHINNFNINRFKSHFRVTKKSSKRLFSNMENEFMELWNSSKVVRISD